MHSLKNLEINLLWTDQKWFSPFKSNSGLWQNWIIGVQNMLILFTTVYITLSTKVVEEQLL